MALPVTFLSDYGYADEYVGVIHAVVHRICPQARVIDLGHGVPRHDVVAGALMLARALPFAAPGVHVAVVDPGVGGDRRAVALRTGDGRLLVGPDNGLLAAAADALGGVTEGFEISESPWRLQPVSTTFHGRDIFAPVAARLACGAAPAEAGTRLEPATLCPLELPPVSLGPDGAAVLSVLARDVYGNLALAPGGLGAARLLPGDEVKVLTAAGCWSAACARTFGDVAPGELLLYEDAGGMLALAVNGGDAAAQVGAGAGDELRISRR